MPRSSSDSTDKIRAKKKRFLAREERIIEKALYLLIRDGIDKVTVSAISKEAGVGKGTVYKHFLTKTEILMRIVLDYERNITENLRIGIEATDSGDPGAAARSYFKARLANPALDRLVQLLEVKLQDNEEVADKMLELHSLRRSNVDALNNMIAKLIDKGILEDVPPSYHYLACWALAQGAVEAYFNVSYGADLEDKEDFLRFVANIGITMGNLGQLRGQKPS
ncbi:TetR/AcrR family transcriptional regulator [Porticoccus litoralis]|uniref:TetR/AcrR family transcriptional regulator n=1 Tax=Porticoccus litoralis TaxID=434086 RepID=A0AAW8B4M1_9GAMM|nr:TetR/AcrR family transcriptional regulator [Porticoccus litoralis]MDP1521357.1 TetR/AcrR family transcriptional regulator [Porticoccus litoralis]